MTQTLHELSHRFTGFGWGWRDSNSHGLPHTPLKRARLPVPPHPQILYKQRSFFFDCKPLSFLPMMNHPSLASRYVCQTQTVAEGRSLTVTIREKKPEILFPVIIPLTVDVIDRQHQRSAPFIQQSAFAIKFICLSIPSLQARFGKSKIKPLCYFAFLLGAGLPFFSSGFLLSVAAGLLSAGGEAAG